MVYSDGDDNDSGIRLNTLTAYLQANHPKLAVNVIDVSGEYPDFRRLAEDTGGSYALVSEDTDLADLLRQLSGGYGGK